MGLRLRRRVAGLLLRIARGWRLAVARLRLPVSRLWLSLLPPARILRRRIVFLASAEGGENEGGRDHTASQDGSHGE